MLEHANVRDNERSDRFVGVTAVEMGGAMDRAYILNAIRAFGREKGASADCKSETLHRLKHRRGKRGVARNEVWPALFRQQKVTSK